MSIEDVVSLITNNGIGITCIIYFIFRDYKFMNTLVQTLTTIELLVKDLKKKGGEDEE